MVLNEYMAMGSPGLKLMPYTLKHDPRSVYVSSVHASAASPHFRNLVFPYQDKKILSIKGRYPLRHSAVPTSFQENSIYMLPPLQRQSKLRSKILVVPRASKSVFSYPELTTKPKWWWRSLACVPYLLPLHNTWSYADAVFQLHPVLEDFEFLANPFLDTIALLPSWVTILAFMGIYFLVIRRKEWPHFLRFHVTMAMLLDTGLQIMATICNWMPNTAYQGKLMVHLWTAVAFSQMYTVVECMRCALAGIYPDVPFLSDAAYVHSDLKLW
ncbi:protein TIC 20-I, chloroplastic-like [Typha latifolia]|uniref:protein TIC 20-I, chloroplastic-like n=1 Tax=Typha latifolia TaxID=4733 RepID=UPI003C2D4DF3